jgi:hypothetical protein
MELAGMTFSPMHCCHGPYNQDLQHNCWWAKELSSNTSQIDQKDSYCGSLVLWQFSFGDFCGNFKSIQLKCIVMFLYILLQGTTSVMISCM